MLMLVIIFLILNTFMEFLFYKNLMAQEILRKKNCRHHVLYSVLRVLWKLLGTWFAVPIPLLLTGMFLLIFSSIKPYDNRKLMLSNFSLVMYLIFTAILMIMISLSGLSGMDASFLQNNEISRMVLVNIAHLIFILIGYLLLYCCPRFFWREDYDRSKVAVYTWFLLICVLYQFLDSVIITLYEAEAVNDILLLCGNLLITILIVNFLNYNYVFAKSEEARRECENTEVLIAQQYFKMQELKKLGSLDALTKSYNRREISTLMEECIQQGHQLVCVFVDLDGLKTINDTYGHTCGDYILKRFADASTEVLQDIGYLARIGGDEFLLIFTDQDAIDVDKRIKELQEELLKPEEEEKRVAFSYGIAQGENSVENYILQADRQMYLDKNRKQRGVL